MSEQEKVIVAIEEYRKAQADLQKALGRVLDSPNFDQWIEEVKSGKVIDLKLHHWLSTLENYYGEKDRPFATYLGGLLK